MENYDGTPEGFTECPMCGMKFAVAWCNDLWENPKYCPFCGVGLKFSLLMDEAVNENIAMVGNNKFWEPTEEKK